VRGQAGLSQRPLLRRVYRYPMTRTTPVVFTAVMRCSPRTPAPDPVTFDVAEASCRGLYPASQSSEKLVGHIASVLPPSTSPPLHSTPLRLSWGVGTRHD
jgi:hypothetical protein